MLNKHKYIGMFIVMDVLKHDIITHIEYIIDHSADRSIKHGIYIYGNNGTGKTTLIKDILKDGYDCIWFNAMDKITKQTVETLTNNNIASNSIMTVFNRTKRKNIIIIDDIENIHYNDKNILGLLVKLIRPKKTKKQQLESFSLNPILFIGNKINDKKIKELMAVTSNIEIPDKSTDFCRNIIHNAFPLIDANDEAYLLKLSNNNLSTLNEVTHLYKYNIVIEDNLNYISNNTTKDITKHILLNDCTLQSFTNMVSDGDRTIISLLYHENSSVIIDTLPPTIKIVVYSKLIQNTCICDYIDRFIYQKQIWELTEISNLIKTFYNNWLLRDVHHVDDIKEIKFTKVLTKYSSEYNNYIFLEKLCKLYSCNKKDIYLMMDYNNKLFSRLDKLYHDCSEFDSTISF